MSLLSQTKEICQHLGIRPQKRFGQNFLIEKNTLAKIIRLAEIEPGDLVLEIGTGFGFLTKALANEASFVITVEADKKILKFLASELGGLPNIELIEGDILNEKTQEKLRGLLFKKDYKVVANLPYQITSSLIRFFLTEINPPKQLILMVQKEVAQRILANPPHMNLLALAVNFYAEPRILTYVSRTNFWPRPKVDSALIKLKVSARGGSAFGGKSEKPSRQSAEASRRPAGGLKVTTEEELFRIIKIGFSHKRKKLIGNLAGDLKIEKEGLIRIFSQLGWQENLRAENLSLEDWVKLLEKILDTKR